MATIDQVEIDGRMAWRVCDGDQCREHEQEWQARVWLHSLNSPGSATAIDLPPDQQSRTAAGETTPPTAPMP